MPQRKMDTQILMKSFLFVVFLALAAVTFAAPAAGGSIDLPIAESDDKDLLRAFRRAGSIDLPIAESDDKDLLRAFRRGGSIDLPIAESDDKDLLRAFRRAETQNIDPPVAESNDKRVF
ncbi:hypothetical protein K438DRAFT_1861698 [Mycena galopus ATCC 62051]|nr:hypothetical protein K438DRAFT_1861698 [Mycena galopus ATCC 62051]